MKFICAQVFTQSVAKQNCAVGFIYVLRNTFTQITIACRTRNKEMGAEQGEGGWRSKSKGKLIT